MTDTPPDWVLLEAAKRCGWECGTAELYYDNPVYGALCDMIAKHEQKPVDRKLLCAEQALHEGRTIEDVAIRAIELWIEGYGE